MTKEELMKYANDPFWQRLRWIFFILFWLLWAAMLAGAIYIILKAPKCSVAKPLSWYEIRSNFFLIHFLNKIFNAHLIKFLNISSLISHTGIRKDRWLKFHKL